jgi:ferric-dicitrate binding protein FerR (iron transport regulator)
MKGDFFHTYLYFLKELAEKFLNNTCTKEEARKVLAWFQTPEGDAFLQNKLDDDIKKHGTLAALFHEAQADENTHLKPKTVKPNKIYPVHTKHSRQGLFIKAAAVILLIVIGTGFYWIFQSNGGARMQARLYKTGPNQYEKITLADGTHIRLNQNSKLWLNQDPSGQYRKVKLQGEAFFKVTHNPKKPFVVSTSHALIQDIGTKFDVKADSNGQNVQVAVIGGKVLFKSKKLPQKHAPQEQVVRLTKGHFGFLNVKQNRIKVNHFAVKNYLSWMNHRIVFVSAPLPKVGHQLEHMYHIKSVFVSNDLKSRRITADFRADSLDKVLSVIAQTLHIHYRKNGNKIVWLDK